MEATEITLAEYWRIIRKRKETFFYVMTLVVLSTVFFTKIQTPVYQAVLELRIEKKSPTGDDAEGNVFSDGGFLYYTLTPNLATEMRMIKSLPTLKKVVEKVEVLPADPESRERVLHSLSLSYQGRISVDQIPETNIITVKVVSSDPQQAALTANAIADVYIVENVENRKRQTKAVMEYINEQLKSYKTQVMEEESKLQKFQQNEKVFEVIPEVKEVLDRMTIRGSFEFESELLALENELVEINRTLKIMEPNEISEILASDTWSENFIFAGLKRRLLELEFERFLLLIDYTEKHPDVQSQDGEIAEVKSKIAKIFRDFSGINMTLKMEEYLAYTIKQLFAENRKEVLFRIVNGFYGDSGSLSTNQLQYVRLKRNIDRLLNSYDKLIEQQQEVKLRLAKVIDDVVTVVSPAVTPKSSIKPNEKNNYSVGIVVALILGIISCFLMESLDSTIATITEVEQDLKLDILGVIPHMTSDEFASHKPVEEDVPKVLQMQRARLATITKPKTWAAESLKMFRTNLIQLMKTNNLKTILFTSSDKQEGKSTILTNMALSMAQLGKKTCLLACNLRRPEVFKIFGLKRAPGVADILMGNITWQEAKRTSTDILSGGIDPDDLLRMPGIDNLTIIPCGRRVDNISELLNSKAYDQLLEELKQNFDVVIIDCSPVMPVPDAITLCDKVDGVVLVYKVGQTPKHILNRAKSNLINAKANILGIVLNDIRTEAQVGYSAYYYRYYADTPEEGKGSMLDKWKKSFEQKDEA